MANFKYKKSRNKDDNIIILSFIFLFVTLVLLISGVIGYRLNILNISTSLHILTKYGVYCALFTSLISLISLGCSFKRQNKFLASLFSILIFLLSSFIVVTFYGYLNALKSNPLINDISTNYNKIIHFRVAKHPHPNNENIFLQNYGGFKKPYSKLKSVYIKDSNFNDVFDKSISIFKEMNIFINYQSFDEGIIEGEKESFWYGFKDDFIVRIEKMISGEIKIDMRSASRSGRSDLGNNYNRILKFISYY